MSSNPTRKLLAATVVALVTVAVLAGPASAAKPTFTGGVILAANDGSRHASLAANGTQTLAVWEANQGTQRDIIASVLSPDGTTATTAFAIVQGTKNQINPDVAWNGSAWLVVWEERISASNGDIRGQLVGADGSLVGGPIAIATGTANASQPAVAGGANGQSFVVWRDSRNAARTATDVFGRRLNNRTVLDGAGLRVSNDTQSAKRADLDPDVAWNGSTYLTVWSSVSGQRGDVVAEQRRPNGTRVATRGLVGGINFSFGQTAVASNGADFMVVARSSFGSIEGVFVRGANIANSRFFPVAGSGVVASEPTIAYDGRYLVVWVEERSGETELWGTQVTPNGTVVDPDGVLFATTQPVNLSPALAGAKGSTPQRFTLALDRSPSVGQPIGITAFGLRYGPVV